MSAPTTPPPLLSTASISSFIIRWLLLMLFSVNCVVWMNNVFTVMLIILCLALSHSLNSHIHSIFTYSPYWNRMLDDSMPILSLKYVCVQKAFILSGVLWRTMVMLQSAIKWNIVFCCCWCFFFWIGIVWGMKCIVVFVLIVLLLLTYWRWKYLKAKCRDRYTQTHTVIILRCITSFLCANEYDTAIYLWLWFNWQTNKWWTKTLCVFFSVGLSGT